MCAPVKMKLLSQEVDQERARLHLPLPHPAVDSHRDLDHGCPLCRMPNAEKPSADAADDNIHVRGGKSNDGGRRPGPVAPAVRDPIHNSRKHSLRGGYGSDDSAHGRVYSVGPSHLSHGHARRGGCRARNSAGAGRPATAGFAGPDAARLVEARAGTEIPIPTSSRSIPVSAVTSSATRSIRRLHIGTLWAEGPAWNGVGRYLVWSDIPNNVQMRWIEEDGARDDVPQSVGLQQRQHVRLRGAAALVRARRAPGRPIRTQRDRHGHRREVPGQAIELAERRRGPSGRRHLVHRSRSTASAATTKASRRSRRPRRRSIAWIRRRGRSRRSPTKWASRTASVSRPTTRSSTSRTPGMPREIKVWDVDGKALRNGKRFVQLDMPGTGAPSAADGIRCDVDGNIWAGARPGVQVIAPERRAHRHDPPAGDVRERLLRRGATKPAVHDGQPVAVRGLRRDHRRAHRVAASHPPSPLRGFGEAGPRTFAPSHLPVFPHLPAPAAPRAPAGELDRLSRPFT